MHNWHVSEQFSSVFYQKLEGWPASGDHQIGKRTGTYLRKNPARVVAAPRREIEKRPEIRCKIRMRSLFSVAKVARMASSAMRLAGRSRSSE